MNKQNNSISIFFSFCAVKLQYSFNTSTYICVCALVRVCVCCYNTHGLNTRTYNNNILKFLSSAVVRFKLCKYNNVYAFYGFRLCTPRKEKKSATTNDRIRIAFYISGGIY